MIPIILQYCPTNETSAKSEFRKLKLLSSSEPAESTPSYYVQYIDNPYSHDKKDLVYLNHFFKVLDENKTKGNWTNKNFKITCQDYMVPNMVFIIEECELYHTNNNRELKKLITLLHSRSDRSKKTNSVKNFEKKIMSDDPSSLNELYQYLRCWSLGIELQQTDDVNKEVEDDILVKDEEKTIELVLQTQGSNCWSSFLAGIKHLLSIIFCCWLFRRHDSSSKSAS